MAIIKKCDQREEIIQHHKGGEGYAKLRYFVEIGEKYHSGLGSSCYVVLPVGSTVGVHNHKGKCEIMCFTQGKGLYNDGQEHILEAGDCVIVSGEQDVHSLASIGDEDLHYYAIILT